MDQHSIQRIRKADFPLAVRGYDRGAVISFLADLADWLETGGGEEATQIEAVRLELERIGEQTAGILTEAHTAAQAIREDATAQVRQALASANLTADSLRTDAEEYAADTRDEADAYARRIRAEADDYAERVRTATDEELTEERAKALKEAERIVEEANRRKRDTEKVISDLEQRRDAVIAELERLASGIAGTATEHRPAAAAAAAKVEEVEEAEESEEAEPADDTDETTVLATKKS